MPRNVSVLKQGKTADRVNGCNIYPVTDELSYSDRIKGLVIQNSATGFRAMDYLSYRMPTHEWCCMTASKEVCNVPIHHRECDSRPPRGTVNRPVTPPRYRPGKLPRN